MPVHAYVECVNFEGFKDPVTSFRVAGVAPCDILTCLMSVENRFMFCSGVAVPIGEAAKPRILESFSLLLFWRRRAHLGSCKTSHFRKFQKRLLPRFVWQVWHLVTFSRV